MARRSRPVDSLCTLWGSGSGSLAVALNGAFLHANQLRRGDLRRIEIRVGPASGKQAEHSQIPKQGTFLFPPASARPVEVHDKGSTEVEWLVAGHEESPLHVGLEALPLRGIGTLLACALNPIECSRSSLEKLLAFPEPTGELSHVGVVLLIPIASPAILHVGAARITDRAFQLTLRFEALPSVLRGLAEILFSCSFLSARHVRATGLGGLQSARGLVLWALVALSTAERNLQPLAALTVLAGSVLLGTDPNAFLKSC